MGVISEIVIAPRHRSDDARVADYLLRISQCSALLPLHFYGDWVLVRYVTAILLNQDLIASRNVIVGTLFTRVVSLKSSPPFKTLIKGFDISLLSYPFA